MFIAAVKAWFVSGWQHLLLGIVLALGVGLAGYVRGHSDGEDAILAGEAKANAAALVVFSGKVDHMLGDLSTREFANFNERLDILSSVTTQLSHDAEISHASAQSLRTAMRGRFTLSPDERLRFECIRRPEDPRCSPATAAPAVPPSVP